MPNNETTLWGFLASQATQITALAAVAFAGYQALLLRRHNRLSVRPHISVVLAAEHDANNNSAYFVFTVYNNGLGPAFLTSLALSIDGERIDVTKTTVGVEVRQLLHDVKSTYEYITGSEGIDSFLKEGRSFELLRVRFQNISRTEFIRLTPRFREFKAPVTYESIYGEKFADPRLVRWNLKHIKTLMHKFLKALD